MAGLLVEVNDGVQVIKFNRPEKKNAINAEVYEGMLSAIRDGSQNKDVVVTVFTGAGDFYSSGNDFKQTEISDMEEYVDRAVTLVRHFVAALIDYPKLLVAVVNGPAIGIAATTLALFDVVFASDKAWFRTPFTQLAIGPEGCSTVLFPRIMGAARASRLLYLNETLSAKEALACGFVTRVYPDSVLQAQTSQEIQKYARLPLGSLMSSKKLVRGVEQELLHRVNEKECDNLKERFLSEEFFTALLQFGSKKSKL